MLHRRGERDSPWERLSYLMTLSVLGCFCRSIPNIVFEWSVYFMVFWPLP